MMTRANNSNITTLVSKFYNLFFDTVTYTVIFFGSCQPLATIENKKATSNLLMALGFLTFINYC